MILHYRFYYSSIIILCSILHLNAQQKYESTYISKVSQQNLQQTVRDLVKCGNRLGGTKSGDKAAQLVFKKFTGYGYIPDMIKDPEKLTYTNDDWKLKVEQPKRLHGLIQHEWLSGFSPSVRQTSAHLTFVKSIEDINEKKIDSGAVLLEQSPTEKMYERLIDAGACCILCYQNRISSAYSNWAMITSLKETSKNPIPMFNIPNIAGTRLHEEINKGTEVIIEYSAKTVIKPGRPKTVVATLQGESDDYYIICAHGDSDSGGPGADDNASGVSGVLEIARIFNSLVQSKKLPIPKLSIRFIVWGSECFSSSAYVKRYADELKKIRGVINFDEIGIGKPRNCIYFEGNDIIQNHDLLKLFEQVGEDYVGKKGFWKEATTNPSQGGTSSGSLLSMLRNLITSTSFQGSTDSYVFLPGNLDELDVPEVKIPSVTVFTAAWNKPVSMAQTHGWFSKAWRGHPDSVTIDYSPYYHSSMDIPAFTTDKEPSNMVWGVNAVGIVLLRLLWR